MKLKKTFASVFLMTFLAGCVLVFLSVGQPFAAIVSKDLIPAKIPALPAVESTPTKQPAETVEWIEEDDSKFKIKLLETGEEFHGDQVNARTGEIWLGLFKEKDRYYVRSTRLKIRRVKDTIVDDPNSEIKTGKSVTTDDKSRSVFLLKNAEMLSEGEIKTVYFPTEVDNAEELRNGTQKTFEFNGENYFLKVENKTSSDEFLGKGSKLLLSHNGKEQVLNYLPNGCNDCFWYLYWVGDLDRDGKLDFYFDLSWHYNVVDRRLFLSSKAEKNKIVRYIANFWTNGC